MHFDLSQIDRWMALLLWPLSRVSGFMLAAPLLGSSGLPNLVRIVLVLALSLAMIPALTVPDHIQILSWQTVLSVLQQMLLGLSIGMCLKLVFEAISYGGQLIANAMGLGFASVVDPQQGGDTPLIGQFHTVIVSLLFLLLNGHLALIQLLADSLRQLPPERLSSGLLWQLLSFAGIIFSGAVQVALTAIIALLITNLGFGVISRAAPAMNMFALGFPISISLGLIIFWLSLRALPGLFNQLSGQAFALLRQWLGA